MEEWLNSKLVECKFRGLAGSLSKGNENPLVLFKLDRQELTRLGISDDNINHLYRTLYVNSVGFFTALDEFTRNMLEGAMSVKTRIWNVFNVLLQYACETEFKMITTQIIEDYKQQLQEVEQSKLQAAEEASLALERCEAYTV